MNETDTTAHYPYAQRKVARHYALAVATTDAERDAIRAEAREDYAAERERVREARRIERQHARMFGGTS